jgi:signal peptidase I
MEALLERLQALLARLPELTEWLANLTTAKVLIAVGVMAVLLALLRTLPRSRDRAVDWLVDHVQIVLSVVVVVFLLIRPFLFQAFYIPSGSMEPTLKGPIGGDEFFSSSSSRNGGDRLLVDKLVYRLFAPARGDIAVFRAPPAAAPDEKEFIKRIIGLPGEKIEVVGPRLLLDGRTLLSFAAEGGSSLNLGSERDVKVEGNTAVITGGYNADLRVVVHPNPRIVSSAQSVEVNGKVELRRPANGSDSEIETVEGVSDWGGDATISAEVFKVDQIPRLVVATGKKLEFEPGHVRVNGRKLIEPYLKEAPRYSMAARRLEYNEYFMMGDNRNNSNDSHSWGPLTRDRIIGRAEILFWPVHRFRIFHWWLLCAMGGAVLGYQFLTRLLTGR